ncbi:hypothetical protein [Cardinium endosymbiont of Sogatella furcifera]|uniref:hypothetical protein n=1 Tax=Cardinium endosymbiont of Sogatella furcifera TaxID=650378 RepID=UPI000E0CCAA3|nr:hypothetical protein [Cardinium endosymbiont of Sogatella furcifera]
MQFIKNKTTHTTKYLLTSSVLILNGHNLCTGNIPLQSNQTSQKPTTLYSPMRYQPNMQEGFIQKVQQLKDYSRDVIHLCNQLIKDANQTTDSLDNDATSPMPSMDDQANDSGYQSEDSYDAISSSSFNRSQKNASRTYPLPLQDNRYPQLYNEPWDKLNHKSTQTEPTHEGPTQIVNTTQASIYDEVPEENIYEEIANKDTQPIDGKVPNEEEKEEEEEPIYEEIKENDQAIEQNHTKQTNNNGRSTTTYYKNGILCTDL